MDRYRSEGALPEFALPTRVNMAIGRSFSAADYVKAQQIRTRTMETFARAFEGVDLIATPTTAITAPPIPVIDPHDGWSDIESVTEVMRYAFPANLTGHPAISVPAGYDRQGLPVGLQLIGRHWEEQVLLRAALAVEQRVERRRAALQFELLSLS
jgi:Asp-tRNA(Asn)/Glu-tRNA(Gln) amidotransferase A subunit family amidase